MIASPVLKRRTDEIAALLGRRPGMSFFAPPTMVKRSADDRAIAEADLSHLKTIIYGGAPMYLAAVVGRTDAKWGEAVVALAVAADVVAQPPVKDLDQTCLDNIARFKGPTATARSSSANYDRLRAETADGGSR
jgi:acyl-CoA synthetase (AMP-forming)/AMP-acid ligase II